MSAAGFLWVRTCELNAVLCHSLNSGHGQPDTGRTRQEACTLDAGERERGRRPVWRAGGVWDSSRQGLVGNRRAFEELSCFYQLDW